MTGAAAEVVRHGNGPSDGLGRSCAPSVSRTGDSGVAAEASHLSCQTAPTEPLSQSGTSPPLTEHRRVVRLG